jgi:hypothetical protein
MTAGRQHKRRRRRMQITNKHNLPETIYNVLSQGSHKPQIGRYSVTDLIGAPLVRILKIKHWEEIEQDVGDMMWLLLGKSVHYILEGGAPKEGLAEEKFIVQYGDKQIVGVPDLWHNDIIDDYKITSVFAFLLGDKPEWENQLNVYAALYRWSGFVVKGLRINAILRDWMKSKADREEDYPPIPFMMADVPLWDYDRQREYISDRVMLHWQAETEGEAPICTPEERWERPTTYAVMKGSNKKAARVLASEQAAKDWIDIAGDEKAKYDIVMRPGESIRCKDYCLVRDVCPVNPCKVKL